MHPSGEVCGVFTMCFNRQEMVSLPTTKRDKEMRVPISTDQSRIGVFQSSRTNKINVGTIGQIHKHFSYLCCASGIITPFLNIIK